MIGVVIISLFIGIALGAVIVFFVIKARYSEMYNKQKYEQETELKLINERNSNLDSKITELNDLILKKDDLLDNTQKELSSAKENLAAYKEKAQEIPKFEEKINRYENLVEEKNNEIKNQAETLSSIKKELEKEKNNHEEKIAVYEQAENKLKDVFKAMSSTALESNNENFIKAAKELFGEYKNSFEHNFDSRKKEIESFVNPLKETLNSFDKFVKDIEKSRNESYGELKEQVISLKEAHSNLHNETKHLVDALKKPTVRGRWGEIQLKRVVEMAGMLNYCDFEEQKHIASEQGNLRPDMIINLPNSKQIVVDSKVSLSAYLDAIESKDEKSKNDYLLKHSIQIKEHLKKLSSKSYYEHFEQTPEFVVCFLPGEIYYYAALEKDPSLIEYGAENNVLIATPTSLISLLKAVAYGWRQEQIAESSKIISKTGKELYERISKFAEHLSSVGKGLESATKSYNKAVGSFESRVLSSARKFTDLGVSTNKEISEVALSETGLRQLKD